MSAVITVRVEDDLRERLEQLADATRRSRSFIVAEALREYVAQHEWQVAEIESGIADADQGKLAPHAKVMKKLERKLGNPLDKRRRG